MHDLGRRMARMMWWSGAAPYPAAVLTLSTASWVAVVALHVWTEEAERTPAVLDLALLASGLASAAAALAVGLCWAAALWHSFRAGRTAFGAWSGMVYAGLALVLTPWPGLYVVPHKVRLDVARLLGVELGDGGESPAGAVGVE